MVKERSMLSSSHSKIHNPRVTGVSPRPTDRLQHQKTAKHEGQFAASFEGVMADAGVEVVKISRAVRSFCLAVLVSSAATAGSPSLSPDVVLIVGGGRGRRRPTAR
jgi:hypothetical protein